MREDIEQAAQALVARLLEIHEDPRYQAVWTIAHVHGQPYKGPTYEAELKALQGALARSARESSSGPSPEISPPAPGGVEARPMKLRALVGGYHTLHFMQHDGEGNSRQIGHAELFHGVGSITQAWMDEIAYRINHFEAGEGSREGSKA